MTTAKRSPSALVVGRWRQARLLKPCAQCSRPFAGYRKSNRFCTRACAVRGRVGNRRLSESTVTCRYCGNAFHVTATRLATSRYCSRYCYGRAKQTLSMGERNNNFRGAGNRSCVGCGRQYRSYDKGRRFCGVSCASVAARCEAMANLRRGTEAERNCMLELERQGYTVCRSAASKGPFDLIAVSHEHILFVQVKRTKNPARRAYPKAWRELLAVTVPRHACVRRELWCWVDRDGWHIRREDIVKEVSP